MSKEGLPLPTYVKFLADCDYNSRPSIGRREPQYAHRRGYYDREDSRG